MVVVEEVVKAADPAQAAQAVQVVQAVPAAQVQVAPGNLAALDLAAQVQVVLKVGSQAPDPSQVAHQAMENQVQVQVQVLTASRG